MGDATRTELRLRRIRNGIYEREQAITPVLLFAILELYSRAIRLIASLVRCIFAGSLIRSLLSVIGRAKRGWFSRRGKISSLSLSFSMYVTMCALYQVAKTKSS